MIKQCRRGLQQGQGQQGGRRAGTTAAGLGARLLRHPPAIRVLHCAAICTSVSPCPVSLLVARMSMSIAELGAGVTPCATQQDSTQGQVGGSRRQVGGRCSAREGRQRALTTHPPAHLVWALVCKRLRPPAPVGLAHQQALAPRQRRALGRLRGAGRRGHSAVGGWVGRRRLARAAVAEAAGGQAGTPPLGATGHPPHTSHPAPAAGAALACMSWSATAMKELRAYSRRCAKGPCMGGGPGGGGGAAGWGRRCSTAGAAAGGSRRQVSHPSRQHTRR